MSPPDRDLLLRLTVINGDLGAVTRTLGQLLAAVATQNNPDLAISQLPEVGRAMIALAGELTRLGVDIAVWLDESRGNETPPVTR